MHVVRAHRVAIVAVPVVVNLVMVVVMRMIAPILMMFVIMVVVMRRMLMPFVVIVDERRLVAGTGRRARTAPTALTAPLATPRHALGMRIGSSLFSGLCSGFLFEKRLPVGHRDLIVVGMNLVEGEEPVSVPAIIDEGRLQRRLYARHLGEIDVAAQ